MASVLLVFLASSVWVAFSATLMPAAAADGQGREHCPSVLCGNVNISFPFGIVPEEDVVTDCGGGIEFQSPGRRGLVETKCRDNTYVRVAADERSDDFRSYFVEGCNATVKPVLGRSAKMDAGNYEELMRDGFLVTWYWPPPSDSTHEEVAEIKLSVGWVRKAQIMPSTANGFHSTYEGNNKMRCAPPNKEEAAGHQEKIKAEPLSCCSNLGC